MYVGERQGQSVCVRESESVGERQEQSVCERERKRKPGT